MSGWNSWSSDPDWRRTGTCWLVSFFAIMARWIWPSADRHQTERRTLALSQHSGVHPGEGWKARSGSFLPGTDAQPDPRSLACVPLRAARGCPGAAGGLAVTCHTSRMRMQRRAYLDRPPLRDDAPRVASRALLARLRRQGRTRSACLPAARFRIAEASTTTQRGGRCTRLSAP